MNYKLNRRKIKSRLIIANVVAMAVLAALAAMSKLVPAESGVALAAGESPYPESNYIQGISWDFNNAIRLAPGSDLWPTTWGSDGNVYTSWGDGGGFGGTNSDGRVSLGFARISGNPPSISTTNIWGGKNAQNPPQFGGKTAGMISVGGALYAWINTQNRSSGPDYKLASSNNSGQTWQLSPWSMNSGTFALASFLNFGKDNSGARDGYVYAYGGKWGSNANVYLARVPNGSIANLSSYQYYAGTDSSGNPVWSSNQNNRQIVFSDFNNTATNASLLAGPVFSSGLGRYLLTVPNGDAGEWGIFDAPEPWGPWTTVDYYDGWGGYGNGTGPLLYSLSTKWMSSDGTTVWMTYSGIGGSLDAFHLIKGTVARISTPPSQEPIAHWKFDEGSGQSASDSSGNGHNTVLGSGSGSDSSDPAWTAGKFGKALHFDGANDYLSIGDKPEFELNTYTWTMWIKADTPPGNGKVTQPLSNADHQFVFSWDHVSESFKAAAAHKRGGQWYGSPISTNLDEGVWYHIAGVYDGLNLKVYLDGSLKNSVSAGFPNRKSGPLTIGAAWNLSNFFDGAIDDVRIYNRPLSADEIQDIFTGNDTGVQSDDDPTMGLVGHWGFNEGSGQVFSDSSGQGHDGTLGQNQNNGSDDPAWTTGKSGSALYFGGNDLARIADHPDFELPVYSWSMWINADAAPSGSKITQPIYNANQQFVFSWDHVSGPFRNAAAHKSGGGWVGSKIGSNLTGGEWYHIVGTYDGIVLKTYLDGLLESSVAAGSPNPVSGDFLIGSAFSGIVDEVRVYNRPLSDSEVGIIFANGGGSVNDAPSITSTAMTSGTENELYNYNVDATDPDAGDMLAFSLDDSPDGMTLHSESGLIEWTPDDSHVGDNEVTVRVTDEGGLFDVQSFTISVSPSFPDFTEGMVANWRFDEGSGQIASDSSGNGHDGTLGLNSSTGTDDPDWTTGKFGGGLNFDGNDLVLVVDDPAFQLPEYSWSMWVKADASPGGGSFSQPISNASDQFVFSWDHKQSAFRAAAAHRSGANWDGSRITSSMSGGTWYHIAGTYDGSNLRIYLDGNLENTVPAGTPNSFNGNLYIGSGQASQSSPVSFFKGVVDDVRIYSRELPASEIQVLANQ